MNKWCYNLLLDTSTNAEQSGQAKSSQIYSSSDGKHRDSEKSEEAKISQTPSSPIEEKKDSDKSSKAKSIQTTSSIEELTDIETCGQVQAAQVASPPRRRNILEGT